MGSRCLAQQLRDTHIPFWSSSPASSLASCLRAHWEAANDDSGTCALTTCVGDAGDVLGSGQPALAAAGFWGMDRK